MMAAIEGWEVWAALAAFLAVYLLVSRHLSQKRAREFEQAATLMGFSYQRYDIPVEQAEEARFHLFSQGHGKKFLNVARGSSPAGETALFDYEYTIGSGKRSRTHFQTVAQFRWPGASLPGFGLAPEHWWHKVGSVFGYQDIDFDSNPEFSKRFLLRGADEPGIRQFFTPSVISFFESLDPSKAWIWEGAGDRLLIYTLDGKVKPANLPTFLEETASAASGLRTQAPVRRMGF